MIIKQDANNASSLYAHSDEEDVSQAESQDVSHILVEESIEEMRNRSQIYDPNISINNVVSELTEIILKSETYTAIDECLYIKEQRNLNQMDFSGS